MTNDNILFLYWGYYTGMKLEKADKESFIDKSYK